MGRDAKSVVRLTADERAVLDALVKAPRVARAKVWRARRLLKADVDGLAWTDAQIVAALDVSESTVQRQTQRLIEHGFEAALERQPPARTKSRRLEGAGEARWVAVACSAAPAGRVRWTRPLLADKLVELHLTDSVCPETVRQTLKNRNSRPGSSGSGSFPPTAMQSSSARGKTR